MNIATRTKAGMVLFFVTKKNKIKLLCILPNKKNEPPQFPKGKVNNNETLLQAAIRETKEETGLFEPNIRGSIYPLGTFGKIEMYLAEIKDKTLFGEPTTPSEIKETLWLSPKKFNLIGKQSQKPIAKAAVRKIKQLTNK